MTIQKNEFSQKDISVYTASLSDEKRRELFVNNFITTKKKLLCKIEEYKIELKEKASNDIYHTTNYYDVLYKFIDKFYNTIFSRNFFKLDTGWHYMWNIREKGITLQIALSNDVEYLPSGKFASISIDGCFTLMFEPSRLLSVSEYAAIYKVEEVTVRQWIRRGKIKSAMKIGNEWRIPELAEKDIRPNKIAQYRWENDKAVFNNGFEYLNNYESALIMQDKNDKKAYIISLHSNKNAYIEKRLDIKSKEKFEMALIANPNVEYVSDFFEQKIIDNVKTTTKEQ